MSALPALRSDLVIKEQTINNVRSYICKDPEKQSYYRFEEEEYFVISQLDGRKTADDITILYNQEFDDDMTAQDIYEFVQSMRSMDLYEKTEEEQNTYLYEKLKEQRRSRIIQAKGSALYFRISVWDPDKFFDKIIPYIGWIWSKQFVRLMNLFMLISVIILFDNYQAVQVGLDHIFDFTNQTPASLLFLWLTIIGTIAIHEIGHGLTCKRFGGECHEIGILFMFFNPCLYANVNDAWMFEKKSHRLYVTFAGCYTEFLFGFIMMYLWLLTQPGSMINIVAFQIVVVAFFSAIFMNFNPLMKFDGYFALSDALESPNLRDRSQSYVKYVTQTKIFRLEREFDYLTKREQWIFFTYGSLVIIYLTYVLSGLGFIIGGILIGMLGKALGVFFTVLLINKVLGRYVTGTFGFIKVLMVEHKTFFAKKKVRLCGISLLLAVLGVCILVPFPQHLKSEGILEPVRESVIRSIASGYVKSLPSPNQQKFRAGEVILELENPELEQQHRTHQLDFDINDMRLQSAIAEGDLPQTVKLRQTQKKLEEVKVELHRQSQNLTIHAFFDGILAQKLTSLEHTFISEGQEIGRLIDPSNYQAKIDVIERDFEGIQTGTPAYFALDAHPQILFQGEVTQIATLHKMQGIARVYQITVTFPNEDLSLRTGLQGTVLLKTGRATILQRAIRWFQKTIRLDLQL